MTSIRDETEFLNLLNREAQLMVFCYHAWSGYAQIARKMVEAWEAKLDRTIWLIDATIPGKENYYLQWLAEKETNNWAKEGVMRFDRYSPKTRIHGNGELCWISNKQVVGFECHLEAFRLDALEERTVQLFG